METLIAPTFNLLVLVSVLVYFLRQPVKDFVRGRHHALRSEVETVQRSLQKAQKEYDEFSSRLKSLSHEVESLRRAAKQDADQTQKNLIENAQKMSAKIVEDARATSAAMSADFKRKLSTEIGVLVLEKAERLIRERLTADDKSRIREDFAKQLTVGGAQ